MARDERFRQYQEAGLEFLENARARAEEFLRELASLNVSGQRQYQDAVEALVSEGRRSTDQILDAIRREITAQLSQLGLATKQDLEDLERRLAGRAAPARKAATKKAPAKKTAGQKVAGEKAATKKVPAKKAAAKKAAGSA